MDESAEMSKAPSPAARTPEPSPIPAQTPPKISAKSMPERHPSPAVGHSETSSPAEPFPELDLDIGAEPNPSPTFAHEMDMATSPAALSLPGPATQRVRKPETGPVILARVTWAEEQESEDEQGDMREATARALEWAKKMFGKDSERKVEGGEESKHDDAEEESL